MENKQENALKKAERTERSMMRKVYGWCVFVKEIGQNLTLGFSAF